MNRKWSALCALLCRIKTPKGFFAFLRLCNRNIKRRPDKALWRTFIALIIIFIITMLTPCGWIFDSLLGTGGKKQETLKFIGWGMGGLLIIFGLIIAHRRTEANMKSADAASASAGAAVASVEAAVANTRMQEKLLEQQTQNAMDAEKNRMQSHIQTVSAGLGADNSLSRMTSFAQLYDLAQDNSDKNLRRSILNKLCAHLRQITTATNYEGKDKPTEEVQTLLDLLFKPEDKSIFQGLRANLQRVYLVGADLECAYMQKGNFREANLENVKFFGAELNNAEFHKTTLKNTNFPHAILNGAKFSHALLDTVDFENAKLRGGSFWFVEFIGGNFAYAELQGAQFAAVENVDGRQFQYVEIDGDTELPPDITFTDNCGNEHKTDGYGKPHKVEK